MSEFGTGYATCLRQFLNHRSRIDYFTEMFDGMLESLHPDPADREDSSLQLWLNGASDHLYGLTRPPTVVTDDEWEQAFDLQFNALDIGHGGGLMGLRKTSRADVERMLSTAESLLARLEMPTATIVEAIGADQVLGLAAESGDFSCPLDLLPGEGLVAAIERAGATEKLVLDLHPDPQREP